MYIFIYFSHPFQRLKYGYYINICERYMSNNQTISKAGIEFIASFEGLYRKGGNAQYAPKNVNLAAEDRNKIYEYLDPINLLTIGYGHLLTEAEKRSGVLTIKGVQVKYKNGLTMPQILDLKIQDLAKYENAVRAAVKVPLTQNQFDALVSFAFNCGIGALQSSTLLKTLNQKNYKGAADQFLRWNKAAGKVLPGLTRRREAERAIFLK